MTYLFNLCICIMVCSTLIGAIGYRKLSKPQHWVLFAGVFALLTEAVGYWMRNHSGNNKIVFLIANPIETILYVGFFLKVIPQKTIKLISIVIVSYVFIRSLVDLLFSGHSSVNFFYFIIIKGLIITLLCLVFLYNLFSDKGRVYKIDSNLLIIITGLLFYYSFSAVFYSVWNYQTRHKTPVSLILQLKPYLYIIYMVFQSAVLFTFAQATIKKKLANNVADKYRS